jgi:hypothetical protein
VLDELGARQSNHLIWDSDGGQDSLVRYTIDDGFNLSHQRNELKDHESGEWLACTGYSGGYETRSGPKSGQRNRNALAQSPRSAAKTKLSKCIYSHLSPCYVCVTPMGLRGD